MNQFEQFRAKWNDFYEKMKPGMDKTGQVCRKTGDVAALIGIWIWRLRKVLLAIPVVWCSIYLARLNSNLLPDLVGIALQNSGEYVRFVTKQAAVNAPLAVTGACLVLMFCSKKTLYPWMISMFSLALPILALLTNLYPA